MKVYDSMVAANRVLSRLKKALKGQVHTLHIQAYRNGRENGYVVTAWVTPSHIVNWTFSESRGSDQIVLYRGDWYAVPDIADQLYAKKEFFRTPALAVQAMLEDSRLALPLGVL